MVANILIGALIAFLPLFISIKGAIDTNRGSKELLLMYSLTAVLMFMGNKRRIIPRYYKFAAIFFIVVGFFNMHDFFSSNVISHYMNIIIGCVFVIRFYETFNRRYTKYIYDGMVIGALIQSVIAIAGYYGFELYAHMLAAVLPLNIVVSSVGEGTNNAVGSLGNVGLIGCYLAVCIPAFLSRKIYKYLMFIPIIALMFTQTYMGICAFIGAALYYFNHHTSLASKFEIFLNSILLMIAAPMVFPELFNGRLEPWEFMAKNASLKHWLIGQGPGWFPDQKMLIKDVGYFIQEHSTFLTMFNAYGLLGFLVLLPIFHKFIMREDKNPILASSLFAAFISSYGHFVPQQATAMVVILPVLAICLDLD